MNSLGKREIKKPGERAGLLNALDDLSRARRGEKRIAQYKYNQESEMKDENNDSVEEESEDDLKDFIVGGDDKFDRQYHEVSDDDENYDENYGGKGRGSQKKVKMLQENTLHQYANRAPVRKPDNVAQPKKETKNKIDVDESKKLMDSLFDEVETTADYNKSSFDIKQLKGESIFANYEERMRTNFSIPLSAYRKSDVGVNSVQDIRSSQESKKAQPSQDMEETSSKKRKREEFTSEIRKTEAMLSKVEISEPIKDSKAKFQGRSYQNEILESEQYPLGSTQIEEPIKTESMIIEEMLMQSMQNVQNTQNTQESAPRVEEMRIDAPSKQELANSACEKEWKELQDSTIKLSQEIDSKSVTSQKALNVLESDGSLIMYLIDVFEYPRHRDRLYLFGKVQVPGSSNYASCCIVVQNMERVAYFVPKELERDNNNKPFSEKEYWIGKCEKIQNELWQNWDRIFPGHKRQLKCKPVMRKYAFELPIPHGPNWYLKLLYPSALTPPKPDLKGETFSYVLGTSWTPLENFLIKRKIRGPGWIRVKGPRIVPMADKASWCQYEMQVDSKKDIFRDEEITKHPPPLKVLSLALKTIKPQNSKAWELGMISGMLHQSVDIDSNTSKKGIFRFSVVRRTDSNFSTDQLKRETQKRKGSNIQVESSEQGLVNYFLNRLHDMDPDVIVAHDAFSSVLDTLITRIKALKIANWSRLGRLKKGEDSLNNGTSMQRIRMVTSGRLICDTYISSRELVRETDYNLSHLALRQLKVDRDEVDPMYMETYFKDLVYLLKLIEHTEKDAFLIMQLMLKLQIIPLTKQLTCIGGNLWARSLQNSRAERNEMLLMHELHSKKYIYPDKFFNKQDDKGFMEDEVFVAKKNKKDKKKYAGGLVLEPKVGLHEQLTLLLDFNSLYPSIIQEYQICFTTLNRDPIDPRVINRAGKIPDSNQVAPADEEHISQDMNLDVLLAEADRMKADPECKKRSVLPKVIQSLVEKRKAVKVALAKETDEEKKESLDIKQKAFKLVANSMYGCLGFSSSRFYAKPIAAAITCCGRRILEAAVSIVKDKLNYDIIYGDTDSIMVNSRTQVITDAIRIGKEIKGIINQSYQCLEIDIDGIFLPLLLLKKKKYAAKKLENLGDFFKVTNQKPVPRFATEIKGVEMVRRDWCSLSKYASRFILEKILGSNSIEEGRSQYTTDEAISAIYEFMRKLGKDIIEGRTQLGEFIINKQLTKRPNDYPDARALPHVMVAKRMKERGEKDANLIMHMIPYVVCRMKAGSNGKDEGGIAMRSYHPNEFEELAKKGEIEIDKDWYMHNQIMLPLTRICCAIPGISLSYMAECFGIDNGRYKSMGTRTHDHDEDKYMETFKQDREEISHDKNAEIKLTCSTCGNDWILKGILHPGTEILSLFCLQCIKTNPSGKAVINHKSVANKLQLALKNQYKSYYQGKRTCHTCASQTEAVYLTDKRCRGCEEEFTIDLSEKHIINNIKYLKSIFDTDRILIKQLAKLTKEDVDFFNRMKAYIEDSVLRKCTYDWISLKALASFMLTGQTH